MLSFSGVSVKTARHELGHVLTLPHHHTRFDRDRYLTVQPQFVGAENGGACSAATANPLSQTVTKNRQVLQVGPSTGPR